MAASLAKALLNPLLTAPIWLALTAPQTRDQLLPHLSQYLSHTSIERTTTALKWLSILGLTRLANRLLNDLAENNFRLSSERHRYDWPREIALVTGGTGGFGTLICKALAAKGLTVICVDIPSELTADLKRYSNIHYFRCDITDHATVQQLASDVRANHGNPSILINNAGVAFDHTIMNATPDQLRRIFDVNIISHYYLLQAFLPAMIADKKGHVVSLASMASFISGPGLAPYSGTKAALLALHEGLQQECRSMHNAPEIRFTIVHPTFAATPLIKSFEARLKADGVPILTPEVVSEAVVAQIMRCKGGQIILAGGMGWLAGIRGFPQWVQQVLMMTTDAGNRRAFVEKQIEDGVKM
ncbi:hypothetical protein LTR57_011934 [Friedmanniomyces endolithicus]|nr:hypothetical protein LTR35_006872 [Friedmanniomyces endolithicus]KAK0296038.1 hypothetical protein LTS00_005323 [Friedmanniomyces endolithicus]KAK0918263.1 hypothetical protein LTR57_011934 [Friedmanniomyces endolithicus]KAK0976144.1 hypothetical protein LTS01_013568 [Friedmanniomyces endolithicus]